MLVFPTALLPIRTTFNFFVRNPSGQVSFQGGSWNSWWSRPIEQAICSRTLYNNIARHFPWKTICVQTDAGKRKRTLDRHVKDENKSRGFSIFLQFFNYNVLWTKLHDEFLDETSLRFQCITGRLSKSVISLWAAACNCISGTWAWIAGFDLLAARARSDI